MSLYIPTLNEQAEADKERSDIFRMLTRIRNPAILKKIKPFIRVFYADELQSRPLTLNEFIAYLDLPMVVRLMDLFEDEKPGLLASDQVKELCERYIEAYSTVTKEDED